MNINNKCKYHCSFQENITKLSSSLVYSMSLSEEEAESKSEAFKESATQDDAGVKSYIWITDNCTYFSFMKPLEILFLNYT